MADKKPQHVGRNKEQQATCQQLTEALEWCFYEGFSDEEIQAVVDASIANWNGGSGAHAERAKSKMDRHRDFGRAMNCENNTEGNIQHTCAACAGK